MIPIKLSKRPHILLLFYTIILPVNWAPLCVIASTIEIDITTHLGDKQTYEEGDTIEFLMNLSESAFVLILYIDAAGNIIQILPNHYSTTSYVKAGLYINIPERSAPVQFTVSAPFGREVVWAYAARAPFPDLPGEDLSNGLKQLQPSLSKINSYLNTHFAEKKQAFNSTSLIIKTTAAIKRLKK